MLTVGLIYNLKKIDASAPDKYLEWDELDTIQAIEAALRKDCNVIPMEFDDSLWEKLKSRREEIDILFNIAEGLEGQWREAVVPTIAEEMGIPYTGSNPSTMALCLDKGRTKEILTFHKIKCPSFKVFTEVPEITSGDLAPLEFPLIVKPLWEGSSKGIRNSSLVIGINSCQNEIVRVIGDYKQPALVEEFVPGREFTVGILGNGEGLLVLPVVELNFSSLPLDSSPIYSCDAKWVWDIPERPLDIFQCPAETGPELEAKIKSTVTSAYKALGCRDWCRIDLRLDKEENPYILELNPIPGILPDPHSNSCFPKAAYAMGWDYNRLINTVLEIACKRYGIKNKKKTHSNSIQPRRVLNPWY